MCWNLTGRGVGECVLAPELDDEASELEPLLFLVVVEIRGDADAMPTEASRDMLSRLASFLRGEGLPGL